MAILGQTGAGSKEWEKGSRVATRFPEHSVSEKRGWYQAVGGETEITAGQLTGDRITWSAGDHLAIRVMRSSGSELIPFRPGMGSAGWGVDLTSPPTIRFNSPALGAGEIVDVIAPNRFQTLVRPEFPQIAPEPNQEVAAGSSQSTFFLARASKLTYHEGRYRGPHYIVVVDGDPQTINPNNGSSGGDYKENALTGTDTFGSITFNVPVGDPIRAINVNIIHLGFYDADGISLQELVRAHARLNAVITDPQSFAAIVKGTTTNPTLGTIAHNLFSWWRNGKFMEWMWSIRQTSAGTAGVGSYYLDIPENEVIDTAYVVASASIVANEGAVGCIGNGQVADVSGIGNTNSAIARTLTVGGVHKIAFQMIDPASGNDGIGWGAGSASFGNAHVMATFQGKIPIFGWGAGDSE